MKKLLKRRQRLELLISQALEDKDFDYYNYLKALQWENDIMIKHENKKYTGSIDN